MSNIDSQIEQLKELTETATNIDLAKALGVSASTIQTWRMRNKIPEKIFIKARQFSKKAQPQQQSGMINLTYYDVEASAGHGTLVEVETATELSFSERYLRDELHVNPSEVFTMRARGDSMYPTLKDGSLMIVKRINEFLGDGIYVFRVNGQLMVKRLQIQPTKLIFKSDNEQFYDAWELTYQEIEAIDFEVVGRTIWGGGKL
ncbi:helix-turn-helix domain-containing protein [Vibrio fluvialis]|nr:helix-turn-helix domain-containing protein [Vibrio fluvialis]EKO3466660.1 helix-turn-helix domain-containing protein [Vibrio fluvialis]EKO3542444.1 helix-turn-helix domain-containing protein [Vibrio fluvialis]EKO5152854.1 helix-turn-helix domain-containing protein [Vibrio fluvialis]ELH0897256.1 helix-turn-helix domain-containing protein [Vibrio fluvialis]